MITQLLLKNLAKGKFYKGAQRWSEVYATILSIFWILNQTANESESLNQAVNCAQTSSLTGRSVNRFEMGSDLVTCNFQFDLGQDLKTKMTILLFS